MLNQVCSLTYEIKIYCGLRQGYSKELPLHDLEEVKSICQEYCDTNGFCVTVSPIEFIYTDGFEPGAVVGIINYPRFPRVPRELDSAAIILAKMLLEKLGQERISVVMPTNTIMLEKE